MDVVIWAILELVFEGPSLVYGRCEHPHTGISLDSEYLSIDICSGISLDLCFHGFVNL